MFSVATPKFTGTGLLISYRLLLRSFVNGKISSLIPGLSDKSGGDRFALQLSGSSRLVYAQRKGISQIFLRTSTCWMLARPMPTNGWVNCDQLNYQSDAAARRHDQYRTERLFSDQADADGTLQPRALGVVWARAQRRNRKLSPNAGRYNGCFVDLRVRDAARSYRSLYRSCCGFRS